MTQTTDFEQDIATRLQASIETKQRVLETLLPELSQATAWMLEALKSGKKILLFGNGGSAADAQHIAAELVGKMFIKNRPALPAIALTTDTSNLTAIGNDFGYEYVFSRQVEALGQEGDVALAISTSGNSPNVLKAVEQAKAMGIKTIALTGFDGGKLKGVADLSVVIPSDSTQRIQEAHLTVEQIFCELIEPHFANA